MRKLVFCFVNAVFFLVTAAAQSVDAASIVKAARNRIDVKTSVSRSRMEIHTKSGGVNERVIDQYSKDTADGKQTLIVFQKPAAIAGTRYLSITSNGKDDKWIFMPNIAKTRRISAEENGKSFMNTDFSYDDISSSNRDYTLDNHKFLREDIYNGNSVYVIESIPKDKNYQYSKMTQWIGRNDNITYKVQLFDKRGKEIKTLEVLSVKKIQNIDTSVVTKMTTISAGTYTLLNIDEINYGGDVPDGVFTQKYLEQGKL